MLFAEAIDELTALTQRSGAMTTDFRRALDDNTFHALIDEAPAVQEDANDANVDFADSIECEDDETMKRKVATRIVELTRFLQTFFDVHWFMPAAIGSKARSLNHILAGFFHVVKHEMKNLAMLERFSSKVVGICSDMGTELGTGEVAHRSFRDWFIPEVLVDDDSEIRPDGDVEWNNDGNEQDGEGAAVTHVFPHGIRSTGVCHILDNAAEKLWKNLVHAKRFQELLGAISDLICTPAHRQVFVDMLVVPQGGLHFSDLFDYQYTTIKEWRWGTVTQVLQWLFCLEVPLRRYWCAARWRAAGREKSHVHAEEADTSKYPQIDADKITIAMTSPWFWKYGAMNVSSSSFVRLLVGFAIFV